MKSFQFQCPKCRQRMQMASIPDTGKQIECPKCGTKILIRKPSTPATDVTKQDLVSNETLDVNQEQIFPPRAFELEFASPGFWEVQKPKRRTTALLRSYSKILLSALIVFIFSASCYLVASILDSAKLQAFNPFSDSAYGVLHDYRRFSILVEEAVNRPYRAVDSIAALKELRASEIELKSLNEHMLDFPDRWNSVPPLEPDDRANLIEKYKPDLIERPQRIRKTIAEMDESGRATESFISTVDVSLRQIDRLAHAVLKK